MVMVEGTVSACVWIEKVRCDHGIMCAMKIMRHVREYRVKKLEGIGKRKSGRRPVTGKWIRKERIELGTSWRVGVVRRIA